MLSNLVVYKGDISHSLLKKDKELSCQVVLWPCQTYRVIAAPIQKLNIFNRTILKLIYTGETQVNQIADLMALDTKFITYLLRYELKKYVKKNSRGYQLNEKGIIVIAEIEGNFDESNLQEFYFFADALTGKLIPRVERTLPLIPETAIQITPKGYPSIIIPDSKGKGNFSITPFLINFPNEDTPEPKETSFSNALRQYNNLLENRDVMYEEVGSTFAETDLKINLADISGIKSISANEKVYLLTSIMKSSYSENREWSLFDPFSLGFNNEIAPLADIALPYFNNEGKNHPFVHKIESFQSKSRNKAEDKNKTLSEESKSIRAKVEMFIASELGDDLNKSLLDNITSAFIDYEIYLLRDNDHKDDLRPYEIEKYSRDVLLPITNSLENFFKEIWLEDVESANFIHQKINNRKIYHVDAKVILSQLETSLLFKANKQMLNIIIHNSEDIRTACRKKGFKFKASVMASLLTASKQVKHTLRHVFKEHPDFIEYCFETYTLRNNTDHDSNKKILLEPHDLKIKLDKLLSILKMLSKEDI